MRRSVVRPSAGVLGHPISHSKSPALHRAAYRALGLDVAYDAHDVTPEALPAFMGGLDRSSGTGFDWLGFSVTMPLKSAMMPLVDRYSPRAERLGFLNTVVWDGDGVSTAYNTDVEGIVESLVFAGYQREVTGGRMGILGGGGTAAAAIAAAEKLGLAGVDLFVRTPAKAAEHADLARGFGLTPRIRLLEDFPTAAGGFRAVVATLPPRAADPTAAALAGALSGAQNGAQKGETVGSAEPAPLPPLLDAAYDPWPSALALSWQQQGGQVVSGLEMLLYQAVEQVRLFTERIRPDGTEPDWPAVIASMAAAIDLTER
ncbi:shikimate dehydrogenase [Citricoccus muralis]|uniref:Shikimate dehydrogenase n=1 Tax=Citricoccus muralis TaxID=169134 RepID=A0A3D9LBG1_9MICC|nr:shikimate dehydrogenase [Citricoccus muralis]